MEIDGMLVSWRHWLNNQNQKFGLSNLLSDSNTNVNSTFNKRVSLFYRYPLEASHHMVCPCTLHGACVVCPGTGELVGQQHTLHRGFVTAWALSLKTMMVSVSQACNTPTWTFGQPKRSSLPCLLRGLMDADPLQSNTLSAKDFIFALQN